VKNDLQEFDSRKEHAIKSANELERILGDFAESEVIQRISQTRTALVTERFNLAVLGGFKRGKSTFINALLGVPLLPTGVTPLTSIVTQVKYGESVKVLVRFKDERTEEISLEDLFGHITEKGNPGNKLNVSEVEVTFNAPLLKEGVTLIDTPGTGSTYQENTKATFRFIGHVDAGIFLLAADPPISENELEFLHLIDRNIEKVFLVQNKIDNMTETEWKEAADFSQSVIQEELDKKELMIYPISAKLALEAKVQRDPHMMSESGFQSFENDLVEFLALGKGESIISQAQSRLIQIARDMKAMVDLELKIVSQPFGDLESKIEHLRAQNENAVRKMKEASYLIDGYGKEITSKLDSDLFQFIGSEKGKIPGCTKLLLDKIPRDMRRKERLEASASALRTAIMDSLAPFIEREQELMNSKFEGIVDRFDKEANRIINEVKSNFAETFDLDLPIQMESIRISDKKMFKPKIDPIISYDMLFVGEAEGALPMPLLKRIIDKKSVKMAPEELEKNAGQFRYDLSCRVTDGIGTMRIEYQRCLGEVISTLEKAMDKGLAMKQESGIELTNSILELTEKSQRLRDIINDIETEKSAQIVSHLRLDHTIRVD
jgi:GTP-binding protein EngB required for normal cell division